MLCGLSPASERVQDACKPGSTAQRAARNKGSEATVLYAARERGSVTTATTDSSRVGVASDHSSLSLLPQPHY